MKKKPKRSVRKIREGETVVSVTKVKGGYKMETIFTEPRDTENVLITMLLESVFQRGKFVGRNIGLIEGEKKVREEWKKAGGLIKPDGKPYLGGDQGN